MTPKTLQNQSAEDIVKALEDAIARGEIQVETLGEKVVVNFTPKESKNKTYLNY